MDQLRARFVTRPAQAKCTGEGRAGRVLRVRLGKIPQPFLVRPLIATPFWGETITLSAARETIVMGVTNTAAMGEAIERVRQFDALTATFPAEIAAAQGRIAAISAITPKRQPASRLAGPATAIAYISLPC